MKTNKNNLRILFLVLTITLAGQTTLAQNAAATQKPAGDVKTDSKILYHNGPLITGAPDVYVIWYGCWADNCGSAGDTATQFILTDFISNVGGTPYSKSTQCIRTTQVERRAAGCCTAAPPSIVIRTVSN
jgi:hypothetical protein